MNSACLERRIQLGSARTVGVGAVRAASVPAKKNMGAA